MTALLDAARELALLGWPVMPIKARSKLPATTHGVKDATVDLDTIERWFTRWPDGNLAVATGTPGPRVLDVDNPDKARSLLKDLQAIHPPTVATVRGSHLYFAGTTAGTISLPFGELRGVGSYVLCPPSLHPENDKQYVWLDGPRKALPPLPDGILPPGGTAGTGDFEPVDLIPYGQRHEALKDATVRFLRAGFTDQATLEAMLRSFFETHCDPTPKPRKDEFAKLAAWGVKTHIAARERAYSDTDAGADEPKPKREKRSSGLDRPPRGDAPLKDHRDYVRTAGGWSDRIDIVSVKRWGTRLVDALEVKLSNGQTVYFERQDHITRTGWPRAVIAGTGGIANPVVLKDYEVVNVFRSLAILADASQVVSEAEEFEDHVREFLAICDVLDDHDLNTVDGRYDLIRRLNARTEWSPRSDSEHAPALIVDRADGRWHVRAGELFNFLSDRKVGVSATALLGRMSMLDSERWVCRGRPPAGTRDRKQQQVRAVLYRLSSAWSGGEGGEGG